MANSFVQYPVGGRTYAVPFQYISRSHVTVTVDGVPAPFSWLSSNLVTLNADPVGEIVDVRRKTPSGARLVDFVDGSTLGEKDLDLSALQSLFLNQESADTAENSLRLSREGAFDFGTRRGQRVADPVEPQDAVNRQWAETAMTSQVAIVKDAASKVADKVPVVVSSTGGFWKDSAVAANFVRLGDRLLVGKTASLWDGDHDGVFPPKNFLWSMGKGFFAYLPRTSTFQTVADYGNIGGLFASQVSARKFMPAPHPPSEALSIALSYVSYNDGTHGEHAYGIYGTSVRTPGSGQIINEWDTLNATDTVVRINSYGEDGPDYSIGLVLNSGGEGADYNQPDNPPFANTSAASCALMIAGNGETWDKGIVFKDAGISPTSDSATVAMEMPKEYMVRWLYDNTNVTAAYITSSILNGSMQHGLRFSPFGALFENRSGAVFAQIQTVPGAVNYLNLKPATTGAPVSVEVLGSDANVDLKLLPKGSGVVDLSTKGLVIPVGTPPSSSAPGRDGQVMADGFNLYIRSAGKWRYVALKELGT